MSIQAMKQALEALETVRHQNMSPQIHPAKVALRAAIAEAERQEPAIWKDIDGYDGLYSVSNLGQVRSNKKGIPLKSSLAGAGYPFVSLWKNNVCKQITIHRLVAMAFIPQTEGMNEVNHIDGDKENNRVENLEWSNRSLNMIHARNAIPHDWICPSKPIISIDCETSETKQYPSVESAVKDGFHSSHINNCIKGKLKTHKGKIWKLAPTPQPAIPAGWQPIDTPLYYKTRCADGTVFLNAVQMPAHAVEWCIAAAPKPENGHD